ncbi:glycoside hydrolase family 16 protein [Noviherbaspirillum cavernae]|uniref:Glycoside hydrolase family 16 protein n=1 Tax=Noviherbaspirillum cavernae TaxID=2320862 RepID=A0A418X5Y3_9BURK|nr:glycoside hydrolase family 16 protein [Noviherbaspirillum cavernae]
MPGPFGQNEANYKLTFNDEFEGNSLDTGKWIDREWYDQQRPINYAVEGGSLKIWPQKDANGNFFKRVINTDGKYYQTYGYFEMEAKLPHGKGVWPAFWLYNHDHADPFRPEIDIMEAYSGGGPASGWSDANLKPTAFAATIWKGNPGDMAGHKMLENLGDLSAGYHKYAMKWEPNRQTFYFDGKEIYSTTVSMPDRMYILVDILFGSASGQPDNTTPTGKSNSFDVKYVRAWQFK